MYKLLTVTLLATAVLAQDPFCKDEWAEQKSCFWDLFADAIGLNDDLDYAQAKAAIKQCLKEQNCKVPKGGYGREESASSSSSSSEENTRVKRGHADHHGHTMQQHRQLWSCVKEDLGNDPFKLVSDCVKEAHPDTPIPPQFFKMMHDKKHGKKRGGHRGAGKFKTSCPYKKFLRMLAMAPKVEEMLPRFCGGDADKATAVLSCIQEATGVNVAGIDRDAVRQHLCENKDSCMTDQLKECRDNIKNIFMSACECKKEQLEPAQRECAEELGIELPPETDKTCQQIMDEKKEKYDLCDEDFNWTPFETPGGRPGRRFRRHQCSSCGDHSHDNDSNDNDDNSQDDNSQDDNSQDDNSQDNSQDDDDDDDGWKYV